jgi:hypothetical protein
MTMPRCRWLLPFGHLIVDGIALVIWIVQANSVLVHRPKTSFRLAEGKPVLLLQDKVVAFDVRESSPDGVFLFLTAGDLLAGSCSIAARPRAHLQTRGKLWDPVWFVIHEALSFAFWFWIGFLLDIGRLQLKTVMLVFLAARLFCLPFLNRFWLARAAGNLEVWFWLILGLCAIAWAVLRLVLIGRSRWIRSTASPAR